MKSYKYKSIRVERRVLYIYACTGIDSFAEFNINVALVFSAHANEAKRERQPTETGMREEESPRPLRGTSTAKHGALSCSRINTTSPISANKIRRPINLHKAVMIENRTVTGSESTAVLNFKRTSSELPSP